jgi:long-chain acyl-CoA synthetase
MPAENIIGFDALPQTIPHFCLESFRRNNKPDALSFKIDDVWQRTSGSAAIERVKSIASGLMGLGVKAGDRIGIISENRPEWSLTDIAILSLGAVNVPIYTTQATEQITIYSRKFGRTRFIRFRSKDLEAC